MTLILPLGCNLILKYREGVSKYHFQNERGSFEYYEQKFVSIINFILHKTAELFRFYSPYLSLYLYIILTQTT